MVPIFKPTVVSCKEEKLEKYQSKKYCYICILLKFELQNFSLEKNMLSYFLHIMRQNSAGSSFVRVQLLQTSIIYFVTTTSGTTFQAVGLMGTRLSFFTFGVTIINLLLFNQ
ncbi:hypothetical protein GQX74_007639 [Glossina fuscipes]|nr:hypothetical protein GQX74_007639 [Glossina fuscipes]